MKNTPGPRRIGVVSGVPDELSTFLPDAPRRTVEAGRVKVQTLAFEGRDVFLLCAGIGKVAAATGAAVAQAASILGVPWLAIKACTDGADGESAASFAQNLHAAARASAKAAEQAILLL